MIDAKEPVIPLTQKETEIIKVMHDGSKGICFSPVRKFLQAGVIVFYSLMIRAKRTSIGRLDNE